MAKFKIGDRVKVVANKYPVDNEDEYFFGGRIGHSFNIGEVGVVVEYDDGDSCQPYEIEVEGTIQWVADTDIETQEPKNPKIDPLTISMSTELTHITIGGKRFRLVTED